MVTLYDFSPLFVIMTRVLIRVQRRVNHLQEGTGACKTGGLIPQTFADPLEVVPIFQLTVWTTIAFKKERTSTLVCVIDISPLTKDELLGLVLRHSKLDQ